MEPVQAVTTDGAGLHERHAAPLDGVRDEQPWPVAAAFEPRERRLDSLRVVTVATVDRPAEGTHLGFDVAEVADAVDERVRLHLVVVDDDGDLREPAVRGGLERLPELALLELAIAGQHEDPTRGPVEPVGDRHSARLGDAHPKRAGVHDHVWDRHVRMPREAAQATEPGQAGGVELAEADEQGV